jgi:hypothetical protein
MYAVSNIAVFVAPLFRTFPVNNNNNLRALIINSQLVTVIQLTNVITSLQLIRGKLNLQIQLRFLCTKVSPFPTR